VPLSEEEPHKEENFDLYSYIDQYEKGTDFKRNTLRILSNIEQLDPLLLKNIDHLTSEDKDKIAAYYRRLGKRIEEITSRCNFFEIYRNKNLFATETYH